MKTISEIFHAARRAGFELYCDTSGLQAEGVTTPSELRPEHLHRAQGFGKVSMVSMIIAMAKEVVGLSAQVDDMSREVTALQAQVAALATERALLQTKLDKVRAAFS